MKDQGIVSADIFDRLAVGDTLYVTYLPEDPKINRLTDYTEPFNRIPQSILIVASTIIGSIGALLIWLNWPSTATVGARIVNGGARNGAQGNGRVTRSVGENRVASPVGRSSLGSRKSFGKFS